MLKTATNLVNPSRIFLIEKALLSKQAVLLSNGTININTEPYTGRSPKDKFIVVDDFTKERINWSFVNQPFSKLKFLKLRKDLYEHLNNTEELYILNGYAGASKNYRVKVQLKTTSPIQALTFKNLVINTDEIFEKPDLKITASPDFSADPEYHGTNSDAFVVLDFTENEVIIGKTKYSGEIKKSIFSFMNYHLPLHGILSMHCSANTDLNGDNPALFFGLSGTGKTTLSLDKNRLMVGDDEHAWYEEGIFNIEGGSYAKVIDINREDSPEIYDSLRFGVFMENVVYDEERIPDYSNSSITENTRASIPLDFFEGKIKEDGTAGHPNNIFFLSADAFGVLPPISKLEPHQIFKYFMLGYTAKLAGTERGIKNPVATFSEGFGKPFLPLNPEVYAKMLVDKVIKYNANVYLVNTGWIEGPYGEGNRIKLKYTKRLVDAAIKNELNDFEKFESLDLLIPKNCEGVPKEILNPRNTWDNKERYDQSAENLFKTFTDHAIKNKGDS